MQGVAIEFSKAGLKAHSPNGNEHIARQLIHNAMLHAGMTPLVQSSTGDEGDEDPMILEQELASSIEKCNVFLGTREAVMRAEEAVHALEWTRHAEGKPDVGTWFMIMDITKANIEMPSLLIKLTETGAETEQLPYHKSSVVFKQ